MGTSFPPSDGAPIWVLDAIVATDVVHPEGDSLTRQAFLESAWDFLDGSGLLGIHEGTIDVGEAFAAGLTDSALVIDEAAAPPRDWVAGRALADVEFWFTSPHGARDAADRLASVVGCALVGIRREEPRDWAAESRARIGPVVVPGFGTIMPPWRVENDGVTVPDPDSVGTIVVIDPGIGFGTGIHPSTRLCLSAIASAMASARGSRVLDFGSGSGILAIAAALLGAGHVDAVEVDGRVHDAIRRNARLNRVSERVDIHTLLPGDPAPRHHLVVANIVSAVLLGHAEALVGRVCAGGTLVLAGLLAADVPHVTSCYKRLGALDPAATSEDGWYALVFSFPRSHA